MPRLALTITRILPSSRMLLAAMTAAAIVSLTDGGSSPISEHSPPPTGRPEIPASIVVKDPESGQFRAPTPREWAELDATKALPSKRRIDDLPPVEQRPDGSLRLHLDGHFRGGTVAHLGEDGRLHTHCTAEPHGSECSVPHSSILK